MLTEDSRNAAIITAFFESDKLLCRFNLNEIFSFQKPLGNKEAFAKVINAIEAKDQEHSGLKLILFVLFSESL